MTEEKKNRLEELKAREATLNQQEKAELQRLTTQEEGTEDKAQKDEA